MQETSLNRRIDAMLETWVVSLLDTANHNAGKSKETPASKTVEKVVRQVIGRDAANESVHMKDDNFVKS